MKDQDMRDLDNTSAPAASSEPAAPAGAANGVGGDAPSFNWRDHLNVHPAVEFFPPMLEASLCELANDILANGLRTSIVIWSDPDDKRERLIDGRNRLDALAIARLLSVDDEGRLCTPRWSDDQQCWISTPERIKCQYVSGGDPYAIALSFNLHRRHLTSAQKRDLISKVLKARPEVPNATVAKQTMADDKTVAKVRRKLEATSEIPRLEKTTGRDGRSRPATTSRAPSQKAGGIAGRTVTAEVDPAASAERRKQEYTADESEREAMTAKDATLREFDGHVLRLAQIINRAEPERFARTSVDVDKLLQLSRFLAEVAGQQPQCADGHSAA